MRKIDLVDPRATLDLLALDSSAHIADELDSGLSDW